LETCIAIDSGISAQKRYGLFIGIPLEMFDTINIGADGQIDHFGKI
jgi:hypothetical protein